MVSSVAALNSDRLVEEKSSDLQRYGLADPSFELQQPDVTGKDNKAESRCCWGDDTPAGSAVYAAISQVIRESSPLAGDTEAPASKRG